MPHKVDDVERALSKKHTKRVAFTENDLLSTGSTLLNLACSGSIRGGLIKGCYTYFVGDSDSGKTFVTLGILAEATINPEFDEYELLYDDVERGALMDVRKFFGKRLARRLEPLQRDGQPSETVEDMYYALDDRFKSGVPFIAIVDSMDSLRSKADDKYFAKSKNASRKKEDSSGSYGDGKAKVNSQNIRRVVSKLRKSGSILIIISQTRDNIGMTAKYEPKTHSGGRALKFYSTLQIWTSLKTKIQKTVRDKKRQLGIIAKCRVKRNRLTGRDRTAEIPIYHSFGVDDIGGCVDYLLDEGHWKKKGATINASDFSFMGPREKLIKYIEKNDLEMDLRSIVADVYRDIEAACAIQRKSRY